MRIYVAHLRDFDYNKELYEPIRKSAINREHEIILPHEKPDEVFNTREFLQKDCDLLIAEVSRPSTGLGIEIGWASVFNVPILCIYRKGTKISQSLKAVTDKFLEYSDNMDLILGIEKAIEKIRR